MRARLFGAFLIGFAAGMICLGVVLWRMGGLRSNFYQINANRPMPEVAFDLNQRVQEAKNIPPPGGPFVAPGEPIQPPADAGSTAMVGPRATTGEANRVMPDQPPLHLAMPIAGVDPRSVNDTFSETHNGHRHEALDIMAPRGTPVLAAIDGNVAKLFTSKQGGLTVYQYDNSHQYCLYYAHLDRYAQGLKEGTLLRTGDVLGYVGSTGDADPGAPHLHFGVLKIGPEKKWWEGTWLDPLPMLQ